MGISVPSGTTYACPARRVPAGTETVPGLCEGTVGSAERIRHVAWLLVPQAAWSPGLTADSLRQSAGCGTVISHHCEILLRSLAGGTAERTGASARLLASAEACGQARQEWLRAARGWNRVTTDTRGVISPAAAEAADLALWTGRLAYAGPGWTLERGPSQAVRPPEALASRPGDLRIVVAAVHHACETVAQVAAADHQQIRTAAAAAQAGSHSPVATDGGRPAAEPARVRHGSWDAGGPVQRILQDLGVISTSALQRAAAIDLAGEQLILDNAPAADIPGRRSVTPNLSRSTGTAEVVNHMLASGNPRALAILRPPLPAPEQEADAEP